MTPTEAINYLSAVAADYIRTLPPTAQAPTVQAINQALATLEPLARAAETPLPPPPPQPPLEGEGKPRLAAVSQDRAAPVE